MKSNSHIPKRCSVWMLISVLSVPLASQGADWKTLAPPDDAIAVPDAVDDSLSIELVAAEPDIVTPISCRFDIQGRLLVIESHTHFPTEDYDGPKHDRVRILRDSDGDGRLDQIATFYEGTVKSMGLVVGRDGWVYLSTRNSIIRIRDTDDDAVADETEKLISLDTEEVYPHNGICGLLLDEERGTLMFGMGENLGADYTIADRDGKSYSGGGEGGNVFECNMDGSFLQRFATGFWNPFGLCRDQAGRVLMVGNDPHAMPPCRICEVLPRGDYGFQYRYGGQGIHPLQSWNGELPGTLPRVAATGEAPCAILPYRGQYWVTSWGDNRIERYTAKPKGASIQADQDVAIVGGPMFRPVDMAVAKDGSMYVTDWVDRSYNVHGQGRIWRIHPEGNANATIPPLSKAETDARKTDSLSPDELIQRLATDDVFAWQWGLAEAIRRGVFVQSPLGSFADDRVRLGWVMAHRWNDIVAGDVADSKLRIDVITAAMADSSEQVRLTAVRWIADRRIRELSEPLLELLKRPDLSAEMLSAVTAAVSFLDSGKPQSGTIDPVQARLLIEVASDKSYSPSIRAAAVRLVPPDAKAWNAKLLESLVRNSTGELQREATRHLALNVHRNEAFQKIARRLLDEGRLSSVALDDLNALLNKKEPASTQPDLPTTTDIAAWMQDMGTGGDPDAGWRVFFGSAANCGACHRHDGRGASVGPDLTNLGGDRQRILQSILEPSREIAPMYVPFTILMVDGHIQRGLKTKGGQTSSTFLGNDGKLFEVDLDEIEIQRPSAKSIMPDGLHQQLTTTQLRDLLALLHHANSLKN